MASKKDAHLYNLDRKQRNLSNGREISSSTTLSFTSQLSSLINASSTSSKPAPARSRPKKEDIFSTHNKNSAKRAKRDLEANNAGTFQQKHSTKSDPLDASAWERSKRKMEEKARLYAAMKRGDVDDEDGKYAVDFDAKWAEARAEGKDDASEDEDDLGSDEGLEEEFEYIDEFGRTRKGTKLDAMRAETSRRRQDGLQGGDAARPSAPSNVIYGDTIQHEAFNPDEQIWSAMDELAKKRDRSLTPPPEEHFDSKKEIRTKGTGFFQFSGDAEERKRQMQDLEKEREETEKKRKERSGKLDERRAEIEKRREEIRRKSAKRKADEFLKDLGAQMDNDEVDTIPAETSNDMTKRIEAAIQRENDEP